MAEKQAINCLNCGHPVDNRFCPTCGQKNTDFRVSLWHVLKEMASETFELDGRVPRTLFPFVFKPGTLTREYNAGKRASYTSPFRLFLAMTLVWVVAGFFVGKTTDFEQQAADEAAQVSLGPQDADGNPITDPGDLPWQVDEDSATWLRQLNERYVEVQGMSQAKQQELAYEAVIEALPKAALVLLPVVALMLKLLFAGTGRFYVEHLVFALHTTAFGFLLLTLTTIAQDDAIVALLSLALFVYVFVALKRAYQASWWATALRFCALFVLYGTLASATAVFFILLGVYL
jgi:hypothetical protein